MVRYHKEQVTSNIAASHRRRLPHEYPPGKALFLTWHLHGGLPSSLYPPLGKRSSGEIFVWMDRYLDTTRLGTMFLKHEAVARCVVKAIQRGADELGQYELDAYVVMSNHVRMLAQPRTAPNRFMKSLKGFTAREANRILGRSGQPFWQAESFDHWVRNSGEHARIQTYIEENPVKAGLVQCAEDYRWSSAYRGVDG